MIFVSEEELKRLRELYPPMLPVVLDAMNDSQAPPSGTKGLVQGVDDAGSILVSWENGSRLSLLPNVDRFHVDETGVPLVVLRQVLHARQTGRTNMFDLAGVRAVAQEKGYRELTEYLKGTRDAYVRLILNGHA